MKFRAEYLSHSSPGVGGSRWKADWRYGWRDLAGLAVWLEWLSGWMGLVVSDGLAGKRELDWLHWLWFGWVWLLGGGLESLADSRLDG